MNRYYIYALLAVLSWGTFAPVTKDVLSGLPNMEVLTITGAIAGLTLLVVNLLNGSFLRHKYTLRDYWNMSWTGFFGFFMYSVAYYYSLTQLNAGEASILNYLWPLFLVILSRPILKEPLTSRKFVAMLLSFAGIVVLSLGSAEATEGNFFLGALGCILAAACYGFFNVVNKRYDYEQTISIMVIWVGTTLLALLLGIATEEWVPVQLHQWPYLLWIGILPYGAGYALWAIGINNVADSARIANLAYLAPLLSLLFGALLLGETIRPTALVSLALIVGGILWQNMGEEPESPRQGDSLNGEEGNDKMKAALQAGSDEKQE